MTDLASDNKVFEILKVLDVFKDTSVFTLNFNTNDSNTAQVNGILIPHTLIPNSTQDAKQILSKVDVTDKGEFINHVYSKVSAITKKATCNVHTNIRGYGRE